MARPFRQPPRVERRPTAALCAVSPNGALAPARDDVALGGERPTPPPDTLRRGRLDIPSQNRSAHRHRCQGLTKAARTRLTLPARGAAPAESCFGLAGAPESETIESV